MAEKKWVISIDADKVVHISEDDFEATITAALTFGGQAAEGKEVQIFVAGAPTGTPLTTDHNGRVADDVLIHTSAKVISIEAQAVGFATRAKKFITLPRPEEKKAKKVARLATLNTAVDDANLVITLARLNEADEGSAGKINYVEDSAVQAASFDTDEFGVQIFSFPLQERKRKITIFLPEKPEQKIELEIPAKRVATPPKPPEEPPVQPKKSLTDRMRDAYRRGRQR